MPPVNGPMTPQQFIAKWQRANLSERSACQQHFLDLCELLEPAQAGRGRPGGHLVHLRARRAEDRRRRRLGRRVDARPLRLGIQGQAQEPQGRLPATAPLPRGPGKPARCWSSATWTASRSTPTSPTRRSEVHALRPGRAGRSGKPRRAPQDRSPSPRRCGRASPARRSRSRPPSASPSWPTGCGKRESSRCAPPIS